MVADTKFYDLLEIAPDAGENDIRKAYRKLAVKWHPDKNPDNREEAEARFKEIAEAYEVLSDPEARRTYDMFGADGPQASSSAGPGAGPGAGFAGFSQRGHVDPFDLFAQFFGGRDPFFDDLFQDQHDFMGRGGGGLQPGLFPGGRMGGMGGMGGVFGDDPFFNGGMMRGMMGGGMMGDMMMGGGMMGGMGGMQFSSISSHGGGGVSTSTQSSTTIVNGQRVTKTTRTIRHADGRVETSTEEHVDDGSGGGGHGGRLGFGGGGFAPLGF